MSWSAALVLAFVGPMDSVKDVNLAPAQSTFASYTQAWHAAHDAKRPMLVILNPPADQSAQAISEETLRGDESLQPLLDDYVLAVIDTGTEHGKQVHELFGSAPLPRVVVIDKEQKYQVFRTSQKLSNGRLAKVLSDHKEGRASRPVLNWGQPANSNCTSCQRGWTF